MPSNSTTRRDVAGRPVGADRLVIVGVAALLYLAISVLRWHVGGSGDAVALLFSIPIALLAVTLGIRAGAAASALSIALLATWAIDTHVGISPVGWVARLTPLVLLGTLPGLMVERLRRADDERHRLELAAEHHRQAVQLNDSVVQGLTAAKWSLEAGETEKALALVTDTLELGHRLVSDLIRTTGLSPSWTGDPRPQPARLTRS